MIQQKLFSMNFRNSLKSILPSLFPSNDLIITMQFSRHDPSLNPSVVKTLCNSVVSIKPSLFSSNTSKASFTSSKLASFSSNKLEISLELYRSWSPSLSESGESPKLLITISASSLQSSSSSSSSRSSMCLIKLSSTRWWCWRRGKNVDKKMRAEETHLQNPMRNKLKRAKKVIEDDCLHSDKKLFSMNVYQWTKRVRGDVEDIEFVCIEEIYIYRDYSVFFLVFSKKAKERKVVVQVDTKTKTVFEKI